MVAPHWCARKPKPTREPLLSAEDAAQIEQAAQHLRQLGCTAQQIERHLHHLNALAAARAPKKPKEAKSRSLQSSRPPTYHLTKDQIDILLPKLAARSWRWTMWPGNDAQGDWVGHAILSIPGVPDLKSNVGYIVGDVLAQLRKLGLIARVAIAVLREAATGPCYVPGGYRVKVLDRREARAPRERLDRPPTDKWAAAMIPILNAARAELANPNPDDRMPRRAVPVRVRIPRERLPNAQKRESLGVSGLAGPGHSDMAASVPSHV